MSKRRSYRRRGFSIMILLGVGVCQPAAGAGFGCLMGAGMNETQATGMSAFIAQSGAYQALEVAIRTGQTNFAKAVLSCAPACRPRVRSTSSRLSMRDISIIRRCISLKDLDTLVEMADYFDQKDIKKFLIKNQEWRNRPK